jgi:FkbM family methyltransferase
MAPDYEQMLEAFYTGLLNPGDTCVDVGAHTGRHTFPMAHCVNPGGRILAFEPIPDIAAELRTKLSASPDISGMVKLTQCALADVSGETNFTLVRSNPGYSGLLPRHYDREEQTETIRVTLCRLDDSLAETPTVRYIKIDCEGAELRVLRGASALLMRDRPIVSFECGDASLESYDYDAGDIFDFWSTLGYSVQSITHQTLDRARFVDACTRQEYWDYIAFPS